MFYALLDINRLNIEKQESGFKKVSQCRTSILSEKRKIFGYKFLRILKMRLLIHQKLLATLFQNHVWPFVRMLKMYIR